MRHLEVAVLCATVLFGSFYFYSHGTVDGMTWACVVLLHTQNLDPLQTQFQFRYMRVRTPKSEDSFRSVLGPSFKQRLQGSPFSGASFPTSLYFTLVTTECNTCTHAHGQRFQAEQLSFSTANSQINPYPLAHTLPKPKKQPANEEKTKQTNKQTNNNRGEKREHQISRHSGTTTQSSTPANQKNSKKKKKKNQNKQANPKSYFTVVFSPSHSLRCETVAMTLLVSLYFVNVLISCVVSQ